MSSIQYWSNVKKSEVVRGGLVMLVAHEPYDPEYNRVCTTCLSWLHETRHHDEGGSGHYCLSCGGGAKVGHLCYDCHDIG